MPTNLLEDQILLLMPTGKENRQNKGWFLWKLTASERSFRLAVVALRNRGYMICSSSADGGYYFAANLEEYQEFRKREFLSRIKKLIDTMNAMDREALTAFSPAQLTLDFDGG